MFFMIPDELISLGSEMDLLMQPDVEPEGQEELDPLEAARQQNLALQAEEEAARAALEQETEEENLRKSQQNPAQPPQPPSKKVRSAGVCPGLAAPSPMTARKPASGKLRPSSPPGPPEATASNSTSGVVLSDSGSSRKRNSSGFLMSQPPPQPQADPQSVNQTLVPPRFSP